MSTSNSLTEMAPLSPAQQKGLRRQPPRSESFHGRAAVPLAELRQMRRPKTQPDLLAAGQRESPTETPSCFFRAEERKVPEKVLVNVTVKGSLGPVQVMASTEWTVSDLVAAAARFYAQEGRRPPLPSANPADFGLHYSQFSLESLDSGEKLIGLGSRNFFLCPKAAYAVAAGSNGEAPTAETSASPPPPLPSSSCSKEVNNGPRIGISFLRFMDFF